MKQKKRSIKKKADIRNHTLGKVYFTPKKPGSFGGVNKLHNNLKSKITQKQVKAWLASKDTYTLHKPLKKKFLRRKFIVSGIDSLWQCDLADFSKLKSENQGYQYILVCIDVFSRYAMARPVKQKTGQEISKAFADIITKEQRKCSSLNHDKGKEFLNNTFKQFLKDHKIKQYATENVETKAALAERVIKSIKNVIYRYFTYANTSTYVNVISDIISSYNNTIHSSIGIKPVDVNPNNQEEIWNRLYNPDSTIKQYFQQPKFEVGDNVRISKYSTVFRKGYLPLWSTEIFKISKVHFTSPPVYSLSDYSGDKLTGTWYEQELQKVDSSEAVYKIEKILSQRKIGGKIQYLVKWLGYPDSFNSYVNKSDLVQNYKS